MMPLATLSMPSAFTNAIGLSSMCLINPNLMARGLAIALLLAPVSMIAATGCPNTLMGAVSTSYPM
jgi:hypothetical protein